MEPLEPPLGPLYTALYPARPTCIYNYTYRAAPAWHGSVRPVRRWDRAPSRVRWRQAYHSRAVRSERPVKERGKSSERWRRGYGKNNNTNTQAS